MANKATAKEVLWWVNCTGVFAFNFFQGWRETQQFPYPWHPIGFLLSTRSDSIKIYNFSVKIKWKYAFHITLGSAEHVRKEANLENY